MNKTISKVTALLAALVVAVCAMPAAVSADSTTLVGSGTQDDPYVVTTAAQLQELNTKDEVGYVQLGADIDMSNIALENKTYVIKKLTGEFDGKGHTISNLTMESENGNYNTTTYNVGFISELTGKIENVKIEKANITNIGNYNNVGVIAGTVTANVTTTIYNCIVDNSELKVSSKAGGNTRIGGLIGYSDGNSARRTEITIDNAISNVKITGNASTYCGGIVGAASMYNDVVVKNCASLGDISKGAGVAGIVGWFQHPGDSTINVNNCYCSGKLEGSKKSAIAYHRQYVSLSKAVCSNFYYDKTKLGSYIDMIYTETVDGCTAKTTAEMKSLNLEGFKVVEGKYDGYPVPVWKTSGGDEPITYSITLDDSKTKAVVSAAKTGTYCVVFASYNGDTLTSVGVVNQKFVAGANQPVNAPAEFKPDGAKTVKAMLLRSLEDIYPLCEAAQK